MAGKRLIRELCYLFSKDEDEQRYVQNRSSVKQVVRQKETVHSIERLKLFWPSVDRHLVTEENSSSTPDTMVEGPVTSKKVAFSSFLISFL